MDSLLAAIAASQDPLTSSTKRQEAYQYCEDFKNDYPKAVQACFSHLLQYQGPQVVLN